MVVAPLAATPQRRSAMDYALIPHYIETTVLLYPTPDANEANAFIVFAVSTNLTLFLELLPNFTAVLAVALWGTKYDIHWVSQSIHNAKK